MNAGISVVSETSAGVAGAGSLDTLTMRASSSGRVFLSMNSDIGFLAASNAWENVALPLR